MSQALSSREYKSTEPSCIIRSSDYTTTSNNNNNNNNQEEEEEEKDPGFSQDGSEKRMPFNPSEQQATTAVHYTVHNSDNVLNVSCAHTTHTTHGT